MSGAISTVCQQPKGHSGKHGGMGCEWDGAATPGRIVGDKGQRFEIHAEPVFWNEAKGSTVMGWHDTLAGAQQMAESAVLHPEASVSWVIDRAGKQAKVYETRKPTR